MDRDGVTKKMKIHWKTQTMKTDLIHRREHAAQAESLFKGEYKRTI